MPVQKSFNFLDVKITRNAYGRKIDSHMAKVCLKLSEQQEVIQLPLIRAPKIIQMGDRVRPLGVVDDEVVLVEQDHIIGATCHPEAVTTHIHKYFLNKCKQFSYSS